MELFLLSLLHPVIVLNGQEIEVDIENMLGVNLADLVQEMMRTASADESADDDNVEQKKPLNT